MPIARIMVTSIEMHGSRGNLLRSELTLVYSGGRMLFNGLQDSCRISRIEV
jgi:hypothetical protein